MPVCLDPHTLISSPLLLAFIVLTFFPLLHTYPLPHVLSPLFFHSFLLPLRLSLTSGFWGPKIQAEMEA